MSATAYPHASRYTTPLHLIFDCEPIGKGRPRTGKGGRVYTPAKTRQWESAASSAFAMQAKIYGLSEPYDCPLRVRIRAVKSRPKALRRKKDPDGLLLAPVKPDADNIAKAVLDAAQKARVMVDDALIVSLTIETLYCERDGEPRVELIIEPLAHPSH